MKNRKKLYKIFRIFIAVVLIINFSFIDQLGKIHLKAAENNDEDIQYIEDIRAYSVEEDDDSLGEIKTKIQNDGYTMVESNLNKGTDSDKEVYLAYKTTKDRSKAIRKLGLLAMDKGYKIKDYSELKKKYLSSNSAVADTLVTVAMEFASCYEMGSPKAIEAYKGLNLIKIPEKNNQLLGEYIVEQGDDQDRDFYLNFLCTAASGLIGTVINFLYTGISAYKNEEDEDGKEVTLNWAQKAVENSLWSDIEEGLLTNGELKSLDQIYEDKARSLHEEIQKFASSYETSLNYYDENYLKEQAEKGGSVEDAVESDEELSDKENKKNMSVYYVESYNLLNKYEINGTTPLGEWFVEMGKKTSEEINIRLLYPIIDSMTDAEMEMIGVGGLMAAIGNLTTNKKSEVFNDAIDETKQGIKDKLGEEYCSIWLGSSKELFEKTYAYTSDADRRAAAGTFIQDLPEESTLISDIFQYFSLISSAVGILAFALGTYGIPLLLTAIGALLIGLGQVAIGTVLLDAALAILKVTTTFIFKAVSALVGLGGLVLVGLVALIIYIIDVIKANSDKDYTTVPDYLIDVATVSGGETSVKYEVKEGDLNGGKGNLGWVRLYSTTDSRIGSPLVVKNGVAPFAVSYGDPSFKNGREALTFFGEKSCGNLNTHMKNDDVGGIYINYTTEYSIKNLSENGENTGIYNKVENPNYLYDIIVSCADNEAEAKANITKKRGFYVWDKNLSPTVSSGKLKKFLDNKQYVYIGYQLTSDPTLAIRDLRVATFNNTQEMYFGSLKYTCAGTLGYNKMPDKNDETIPQDLDGLYYSADKKSGTPIRLENLHILTSHADAKEGWVPVTTFSGLPYNFNTTRVSLNKKIAVAGDYFLGPYRYTLNMDEYDKSFDCTYIYYEPEEVYTSGKKYLSGLFFIFGSDAVECLTSVGERAVAFADFITETKKIPNVTVFSDNNIASSFVYEGYSRESNQKYLHLCYTWSYNPYRALYDIDTYQGTLYNFELPYSIRKTLTYSKNKYGDPAETESYASASVYARRPLKPINEYAEDLIGIGVSPENAYMSSNGLIGRDEQVWEETYTKELQGGYDYGFTQMALLPTGLYVSGYVSDKEPLALEDVVISNNAYKAENIDGELVTKITNDKTLDGTEATGDFNSIQELKRPHRIEPFDLSYPEWTDDNDNTYKKGKHTYIYTREKRIKKKYISRIFVGEFSREESGYDDEDYLKEVDKVVDHQALLMATTQASDEVIPVNVAINQNEAWYRRKVDEDEELAAYEPDEDLKTPAAYLSVSRTDKTSEAVKGILLYKTDKDAVPEMIFVNHMEYYCGSTTIPIKRKNGSKYYLYYTYNTGANPGKPFTDITADSEVFQPEQSTALVINKPDNGDELSTPYGDITMETFIHGKYENGRNEYFNNFYLGSGDSRKEACLELLEQGCTEFIDMNMNKNAGGYKVYMGYKKYGLDEDAIKEKTTEAAKQAEIDRQMEEAVYDIMFTVGKPYQKNGFLSDKYQIYYLPVKDVDLNEGTDGPEIYMYFTTRYNAKLYNKRQGSDTRDNLSSMPDEYYKEPISRLSFTIGDKVPNIKDKFSQGLSNSLPWERVLCDDSKTVAELNEGAFGFDEDYNTEENRIYMFVQRADGYVKAPGEIVGGCTDEETYYGEMWFYK